MKSAPEAGSICAEVSAEFRGAQEAVISCRPSEIDFAPEGEETLPDEVHPRPLVLQGERLTRGLVT